MVAIPQIVKDTVAYYAGGGHNLETYAVSDDRQGIYTVLAVTTPVSENPPGVVVMARIEGEWVLVEADNTDRPLVDRLVAAGIPRERIILTYAGETIPQPHDSTA